MNVLVTGANGMIGTAVVHAAAAADASLRVQVGTSHDVSGLGSARVSDVPSVSCDITDVDALRPLADGADVVIHLAGPPSVAASFADPAEFLRAHVLGTATVVQLCRDHEIGRLVHVSSAEVYGRPRGNPVDEGAPTAPRSPYAAAKLGAESVIGAASLAWGLDAVVLRPFSVYGPGVRRDSVLGLILQQALAGDRIRLRKLDGIRDYCFVGDLADAAWRAATIEGRSHDLFNVATGIGTRVDELALAALEARDGTMPAEASVEAWPVAGEERPVDDGGRPASADIGELIADVTRARDELGWLAATSLTDGLRRTLDWYTSSPEGR